VSTERRKIRTPDPAPTEGARKVFIFQDRASRRDDVMAFYGDATSVRPLAFAATIKEMKGLLYNG